MPGFIKWRGIKRIHFLLIAASVLRHTNPTGVAFRSLAVLCCQSPGAPYATAPTVNICVCSTGCNGGRLRLKRRVIKLTK